MDQRQENERETLSATAELAARARDGDQSAFTALIERFHPLVFKIALYKCRNRSDAEDLAQEVFMHAHRSLKKLRDPAAFLSWLVGIAHNRGNRFCRTRARKVIVLAEARSELAENAKARSMCPEQDEGELAHTVRGLPAEYRLALTWKYLDGESYGVIGDRLSLSFHQVDYLLRRAKSALRDALKHWREA